MRSFELIATPFLTLTVALLALISDDAQADSPAVRRVTGTQNCWFVPPEETQLGKISIGSREAPLIDAQSITMTPHCVWGRYVYKFTRLESKPNDLPIPAEVPNWPHISSSRISFTDARKAGNRLLLNGEITKIEPDRKSFVGVFPFAGEDITFKIDITEAKPRELLPTRRGIPYGPHWRQTFDFYQVKSDKPTPLVVMIHGGGWGAFSKDSTWGMPPAFAQQGISFASIGYRYIGDETTEGLTPPVKAPLLDAARAIQTIRAIADELNIDKDRIATIGGSAGGCSSLWLALHDDMADPTSDDPIARESTKPNFAVGVDAQVSLDPHQTRAWVPQMTYGGHAFGIRDRDKTKAFQEYYDRRDELLPWINEYSPYALADKNDPPIYLCNPVRRIETPTTAEELKGWATHSPVFSVKLHERLKELGVESYVSYKGCYDKTYPGSNEFLIDKLTEE